MLFKSNKKKGNKKYLDKKTIKEMIIMFFVFIMLSVGAGSYYIYIINLKKSDAFEKFLTKYAFNKYGLRDSNMLKDSFVNVDSSKYLQILSENKIVCDTSFMVRSLRTNTYCSLRDIKIKVKDKNVGKEIDLVKSPLLSLSIETSFSDRNIKDFLSSGLKIRAKVESFSETDNKFVYEESISDLLNGSNINLDVDMKSMGKNDVLASYEIYSNNNFLNFIYSFKVLYRIYNEPIKEVVFNSKNGKLKEDGTFEGIEITLPYSTHYFKNNFSYAIKDRKAFNDSMYKLYEETLKSYSLEEKNQLNINLLQINSVEVVDRNLFEKNIKNFIKLFYENTKATTYNTYITPLKGIYDNYSGTCIKTTYKHDTGLPLSSEYLSALIKVNESLYLEKRNENFVREEINCKDADECLRECML